MTLIFRIVLITFLSHLSFAQTSFAATESDDSLVNREPSSVQPLSNADKRTLARGEISDDRYVWGGVAGSLAGFGLGHAIQQRYRDGGWIFTAGEGAGFGLMFVGIIANMGDPQPGTERSDAPKRIIAAGAGVLLGFKIWEIIDVWTTPPKLNERYRELNLKRGNRKKTLGFSDIKLAPSVLSNNKAGLALTADF